ncbi:MAG: GntR family transcriptional regulator [Streptosporangiaceae bacterium]
MSVIEPNRKFSRPIDRTTATEAATKALRAIILSGEVPAGAPLRQDDVARRLGVSRTPLREALQRLEAEGLVRLDVHKGAVVAKPSIAQVSEIFELQQLLEPVAGHSAIQHRTESDLTDLREIIASHTTSGDPAAWEAGNAEFHARLYDIARKPLLTEMIGQLRNRSGLYVHILAESPQGRLRAHGEHLQMVAALEAGDTARLKTLIREHLQATLDWLRAVIDD